MNVFTSSGETSEMQKHEKVQTQKTEDIKEKFTCFQFCFINFVSDVCPDKLLNEKSQ